MKGKKRRKKSIMKTVKGWVRIRPTGVPKVLMGDDQLAYGNLAIYDSHSIATVFGDRVVPCTITYRV